MYSVIQQLKMSGLALAVLLVLGASLAKTSCPPKEGEEKCVCQVVA